jgi:hypothetical protein
MYVRTTDDGPYFKIKDYDIERERRKFKPIGWFCDNCTRFQLKAKLLTYKEYNNYESHAPPTEIKQSLESLQGA